MYVIFIRCDKRTSNNKHKKQSHNNVQYKAAKPKKTICACACVCVFTRPKFGILCFCGRATFVWFDLSLSSFHFFSPGPRDWPRWTLSPILRVLCRVGSKTSTNSIDQSTPGVYPRRQLLSDSSFIFPTMNATAAIYYRLCVIEAITHENKVCVRHQYTSNKYHLSRRNRAVDRKK